MGRCLNPQYGHVILVSGYPVLTAVNNMDVQYQVAAPNLASKYDISHWCPCGADRWSRDYQNFWDG